MLVFNLLHCFSNFSSAVLFGKLFSDAKISTFESFFFFNVFLSAFDCIRVSCRTVSSSIFIAAMEAKTDYVIVPSIYSQNLTRCQRMKNPNDHSGI